MANCLSMLPLKQPEWIRAHERMSISPTGKSDGGSGYGNTREIFQALVGKLTSLHWEVSDMSILSSVLFLQERKGIEI